MSCYEARGEQDAGGVVSNGGYRMVIWTPAFCLSAFVALIEQSLGHHASMI